jgi:aminocarboxymuconate-semialdehyde decarboxylase
VNSGLAEFCTHEPARLRWLAHVPLQAPDAAAQLLAEAAGAGAVGAQIGTSVAGTPLADAGLDRFWASAEEHDLALMLHPAYNNPHPGLEGYHLQNAIGNQLETTIAAERLIVTGVLDRHPGLCLLLVHAGGYMPWQAGRLRHAATVHEEAERGGNVAMGTDLPFDMATPQPVAALEAAVDADGARGIMEETPRRLFRL